MWHPNIYPDGAVCISILVRLQLLCRVIDELIHGRSMRLGRINTGMKKRASGGCPCILSRLSCVF